MIQKIAYSLGTFVAALILFVIICYPFMILWNSCLVGTIDGVHEINYPTTLGLVSLFGLLIVGVIVLFSLFTHDPNTIPTETEEG